MNERPLEGRTIMVTGGARRVGRILSLACGRAGADVIIHHGHSERDALDTQKEIASFGRQSWILPSDLSDTDEVSRLISRANDVSPLYGLVNSAAVFQSRTWENTTLADWQHHIGLNLTAPFLLSQAFAKQFPTTAQGGVLAAGDASAPLSTSSGKSNTESIGRIVNILDWRALRPGPDHFPYTVSKAALAALTKSLAAALAPRITVNGLAFGAILPPSDRPASDEIIKDVPAKRWSKPGEVDEALVFLLSGPPYITGEIIHVDGGRHLI